MKANIIPDEWKSEIDQILVKELLDANRYFAQENLQLSKLVQKQATKDPLTFYSEIVERWQWHNKFYEALLEPNLGILLPKGTFDITPSRVTSLMIVYEVISLVDQATLVPTAAIKKHVEFWVDWLKVKMVLTNDELNLLITPCKESFWIEYNKDHLEYFFTDGNDKSLKKQKLLEKYHLNDKKIFEGRLNAFGSLLKIPRDEIMRRLNNMRKSRRCVIEQFYLYMERPYARALSDTIAFDNTEEYQFLMTCIGISGFIFRKNVLGLLDKTKILPNYGHIYEFSDKVMLNGLEKLRTYRGELMIKQLKPYQQRGDTCAAVCLMMVLNYYGLSDLNGQMELEIYRKSVASLVQGSHLSALQKIADELGLESKLVHSEQGMFVNNNFFDGETFKKLREEYKSFSNNLSSNAKIVNGVPITPAYLGDILKEDYLIILAGLIGMGTLHAVVIAGYYKNQFVVYDPLWHKQSTWSPDRVMKYAQTPIGSWLLAIRKGQENLRKLIDALPMYKLEARKFLDKKGRPV